MHVVTRPVGVAATLTLLLGWTLPAEAQRADAERYWGQWRGPDATGVSRHADPPLTWSETEHVAWKVEVPGRGSASPIVWGDKVFLLTAVPIGDPGAGGCAGGFTAPAAAGAARSAGRSGRPARPSRSAGGSDAPVHGRGVRP